MRQLMHSAAYPSLCNTSLMKLLAKSTTVGLSNQPSESFSTWIRKERKLQELSQKSMEYEAQTLRNIFAKYQGLLALQSKVPLRDNYSLSLTYTPGVGKSCKEIQREENLVLEYTNKKNSILVITDSTGFKDYSPDNWNNYIPIPYLEALCLYYKAQVNIDAYPIILDYTRIKNEDDILEILVKLAPGYAGYELYHITNGRLRRLQEKFNALPVKPKVVLFTQLERNYMEYKIVTMGFKGKVHSSLIISAIMRAALDTCSYGIIQRDLIDIVLKKLKESEDQLYTQDYYYMAYDTVNLAAQYFLQKGLNQDKTSTLSKVEAKFSSFLIEGPHSWIEPAPSDFVISNHSIDENSLLLHKRYKGVIELQPKITVKDPRTLDALLDITQITEIAEEIKKDPSLAYEITCKRNLSTIITNGTAVLGFGDIGAAAGLPVMEGKSCLFKLLGGVDLVPLCVDEKDPQKLLDIIRKILPVFSAINLEDIKAPECFEIERTLIEEFDFPIFHDDQHGTAIVVTAAMMNACKLTGKQLSDLKIVINGSGAAGISIAEILLHAGAKDVIMCDTKGAIYDGRTYNMNKYKDGLAKQTNKEKCTGLLADALVDADAFVGVSAPKALTKEMIKTMKKDPFIFALANPIPEIYPTEAKEAGAFIVCTGRSDFKNQVNNCLAFPGIFRGLLDIQAKRVTMELKVAAATAIANIVSPQDLNPDHVIPNALDSRVSIEVAKAVAKAGIRMNLNVREIHEEMVEDSMKGYLLEGNIRKLRKKAEELKP